MKNKRIILTLVGLLALQLYAKAQANLEVLTPTGCESGFCSVSFSQPTEAGLQGEVAVVIKNTNSSIGGRNLTGSYTFISAYGSATCAECSYFSIEDGSTGFDLGAGIPKNISVIFKPPFTISSGGVSVVLRITADNDDPGTDPNYPDADATTLDKLDVDIKINAEVKKTVINYSLVLDRSGSMNTREGGKRRIEILSEALSVFWGLEQLRVGVDSIGIVRYNNVVDASYLSLSDVSSLTLSAAESKTNEEATNDADRIQPRGSTATGNAVIASINTHFDTEATSAVKNAMILFSDGHENTGHRVNSSTVTTLLGSRQDVNIYTMGMGSANWVALKKYSEMSGLGEPLTYPYNLNNSLSFNQHFFKIYQHALGYASISDPTYYVTFPEDGEVNISDVWISSAEVKLVFAITHNRSLNGQVDFKLLRPSGAEVTEGIADGLITKKVKGGNHLIYEVTIDNAGADAYVGKWSLKGFRLNGTGQVNLSNVPVSFDVAGLSNLVFAFETITPSGVPGEELTITAEFNDTSTSTNDGVQLESFDVTVTPPSGEKAVPISVKEVEGKHMATFSDTKKKGVYTVYARAVLITSKGERATRDAVRHVVVGKYKKPCFLWIWISKWSGK